MSNTNNYETYKILVEKAKEANKAYYDDDEPIMRDPEYDKLMQEIKTIEAAYPEYVTTESPTQYVGGTASKSTFEKVQHTVPMLSLQDVFSEREVEDWLSLFPANTVFSVEEKIDGLSISVTYENGMLVRAETRGDGYIGEDITENARFIQGIPQRLTPVSGGSNISVLEVRCEVYLMLKDFERLNEEKEALRKKPFANPRNAAAGILRTKDTASVKNANLWAFAFNVQRYETLDGKADERFDSQVCALHTLKDLGFNTVRSYSMTNNFSIIEHIQKIGQYKNNMSYWMDGAVIKVSDTKLRKEAGETSKYPKWAIAFKYPPEEKETVIRDIILQTGRTGRVTPVAIFDPVFLAGTKVEKATLHNPQIIEKLGVNIGDTVLVRKAAEIIPEVIKVTKPAYYGEVHEVPKPHYEILSHTCPSCGGMLTPDEDGNGAYCTNSNCPAQIARKFEFWASRECMNIEGFGPAQIDKFIKLGWLNTLPDIYRLNNYRDEMAALDDFGEKSADKLLAAIEKSKDNDIDRLIKALGMPGIGRHIGKELAKRFPGFYAIMTLSLWDLEHIDGIGEISAKVMYDTFQNKEFQDMMVELCNLGVNVKSKSFISKDTGSIFLRFEGKTFVITGTLPSMKREDATYLIEKNGGKISGSVSKKTDYLLAGEKAGSKLTRAQTLGIQIISESDFLKMLKKMED